MSFGKTIFTQFHMELFKKEKKNTKISIWSSISRHLTWVDWSKNLIKKTLKYVHFLAKGGRRIVKDYHDLPVDKAVCHKFSLGHVIEPVEFSPRVLAAVKPGESCHASLQLCGQREDTRLLERPRPRWQHLWGTKKQTAQIQAGGMVITFKF